MKARGNEIGRRMLGLLAVAAFPWPTSPVIAASTQEVQPAGQQARTAASHVAEVERAFDRLDAEAGVRSGGAFPFDYQHLVFYPGTGQSPGDPVDVWTAVSVGADRVRGVFDGGWKYSLDLTVELYRADSLVLSKDSRTSLTLSQPLSPVETAGKGFPIQALLKVPPGEYRYLIRVRDNAWGDERGVNETSGRLVVPERVTTQPFVSSVAIAADSAGTWRPAPGLDLQLNAARIVYRNARPFVYFEAYGLTPGADYRGEVRVVSRSVTRGAEDVFDGAYQPFQLQYRGSVPNDSREPVRKVLRLDLEQTRPGPYEVQVRVRDLATGQASEVRSSRVKVREQTNYRPLLPVADVDEGR